MIQPNTPNNVQQTALYAWVGEDELGSGEVGLKQAMVPAGCIPLVSVNDKKIDRNYILAQLQRQANVYGKPIRLCKYVFVEELITIMPELQK